MEKDIKLKLMRGLAKSIDKKQSVTLLCEKAGISRAAFYLYYKDYDDFLKKTAAYITEKFFSQITRVMFCREDELALLFSKRRIFFDETESKLLAYFADGKKYIDFAIGATETALPGLKKQCKEKFGEEFFEKNEYRITYCLNGIATLMFFNLVNYDENKIIFEIKESRKIMKTVLGEEISR